MAEREIASIVWHEASEQVELLYVEGEPDRIIGAGSVVAELARSVGLFPAPSPPGTLRWVRDPGPADPSPP